MSGGYFNYDQYTIERTAEEIETFGQLRQDDYFSKQSNQYENFIHDKYGYCYYAIEPDRKPIIFGLFTEPEYRRRGYARKHLQYVIAEIQGTGYLGPIQIDAQPAEDSIDKENLIWFYKNTGLEIIAPEAQGEEG